VGEILPVEPGTSRSAANHLRQITQCPFGKLHLWSSLIDLAERVRLRSAPWRGAVCSNRMDRPRFAAYPCGSSSTAPGRAARSADLSIWL